MKDSLSAAVCAVFLFTGNTLDAVSDQAPRSLSVTSESVKDAPLTFDVASIRELEPSSPPRQHLSNPSHMGSLDAVMRLSQLTAAALDVNFRFQLAEGPDWLDQQNFVIRARADADADRRLASLTDEQAEEEKRHMLLRLLQDRFGLSYHSEQRPGLTYFVTAMKETPGLRLAPEPWTNSGIASGGVPTDIVLTGHSARISQLVGLMSYYLKAPVVDQTGLEGRYDFKVHFNARPDLQSDAIDAGPLPEQAFPEQVGLKLVRGKAPLKVIVIDAAKKPTAN